VEPAGPNIVRMAGMGRVATGRGRHARHAVHAAMTLVGIHLASAGKGRTLTAAMADKVISSERRGMGVDVNATSTPYGLPYAGESSEARMYTSASGELKVLAKMGAPLAL